jgi:hypothetical protein
LQTGVPVAREIPILLSPADPQMPQARSGPGRQLWQTGPGDRGDAPRMPALRAGLPAARVAVPAVLADGLPAVVAPGDGAHLPAPPAAQGPGLAAAPAADPEPAGQAAEGPLPAAAGAGRLDHGGRAGAGERADEPQDAGEGSAGALACEQAGPGRHGGSDAPPSVGPRRRLPQRRKDGGLVQRGVERCHHGKQGADRVRGP